MSDDVELKLKKKKNADQWLPFVLLTLIGLCIFFTEPRDGGFVPGGFYSSISVHGMVLSKNLLNNDSPLLMYMSKELKDGVKIYNAYNRFPVFPFLITGIVIYPFENDYFLQVYIARQLMNLFFFLSFIIVFKIVTKLLKNKYKSLIITILTFSSYYMLTYNNMIFNDIPALFGFVIALYCVIKTKDSKLKTSEILFYSVFPIMFGWQPFAVYITWFCIESTETLFPIEKTSFKRKTFNLFKQTSFKVVGISIITGIIILGLQLFNEWRIVGGSFWNLPSVGSLLWRTGIKSAAGYTQFLWLFEWFPFLSGLAHSITIMLIPFWPVFQVEPGINASIFITVILIIYVFIRYLKNRVFENKILLIFLLSGLLWALPMRHFVALHEFQSIFYLGFVIGTYSILFSNLKFQVWKLLAFNITIFFLISIALSNHLKRPDFQMKKISSQFIEINEHLPVNSKVYFDGDRSQEVSTIKYAIDFFLTKQWYVQLDEAEFVISKNPDFNAKKLTNNTEYNLFKVTESSGNLSK